jgi:hypothetical protein
MKQTSLVTILTDSLLIQNTHYCTHIPRTVYDKHSHYIDVQFAAARESQPFVFNV